MMRETDLAGSGGDGGDGVNVFDLLPGGAAPSPTERYVAFIVLGALAFLILVRRGFPRAR